MNMAIFISSMLLDIFMNIIIFLLASFCVIRVRGFANIHCVRHVKAIAPPAYAAIAHNRGSGLTQQNIRTP